VPNPVINHGHKIFYRVEDTAGVIFPILVYGEYEPGAVRYIQRLLSSGMNVVDVGAHIGYHTLLAARAVAPNGRVYAFEPVPSTVAILEKNISANGYKSVVTVVPKAVADKAGRASIFFNEELTVSATAAISRRYPPEWATATLEVEATSLDEFFSAVGWPPVHLVKVDVEGLEKSVIDGMKELSSRNPHLKLLLEVHEGVDTKELFERLQQCGFSQVRMWGDMGQREVLVKIPRDLTRFVATVRYKNKLLCD
jgi:FkbM family methyltransferase